MPSIGKDLAAIRSHLGYSVEDIQQATKIPLVTLKSIEDGSIFEETDEIKTYVRSFVRSYGRAIKLNDELLVEGLNQQEAGNYDHLLLGNFPQLQPKENQEPEPTPKSESSANKESKEKKGESAKQPERKETEQQKTPPKKSKPKEKKSELKDPPGVRSVDWQDMGKRFTPESKKAPVWITATIVIAIILFGAIYFLSGSEIFSSDDIQEPVTEQETPSQNDEQSSDDLSLDLTEAPQEEEVTTAELDDLLYVTLYAATDRLDPVRVYSDEKPRIDPYWINQGQAFNFEFRDTIRVRGQYSRMLLFLNGHLIENPRQEHFNPSQNAIELTRDIFEDDPKWATPIELEVPENIAPPDSIIDRPRF
ncbi:MAG: helix-turn-helix domain-containing protein [Balneolaceae bacterium]